MSAAIDAFLAYAVSCDPGFAETIRGATDDEIAQLARLSPLPLPDDYRAFLARMGHGDGGLNIAMEGTSDISAIIEHYRRSAPCDHWPAGSLVIATGRLPGDIALLTVPDEEPWVVFTDGAAVSGLYADSLVTLLHRAAFAALRLTRLRYSALYDGGAHEPDAFAVACQAAAELGFEKQWFSDEVELCGAREDALLAIAQYAQAPLAIAICSDVPEEAIDVRRRLARALGDEKQTARDDLFR
ncbi:MAG: SMI1/KNR4 family protein [Deltaproteobacteria bacterium]|nr:SMI1/KNR4 family protein [Deltaproteobacteria bacterium]